MNRILNVWNWMGKGLSSMALSPTMESLQHLLMPSSTSRAAKRRVKHVVALCARGARVFEGEPEVICQLQCKCCDTFLSPSNPSNACKTHLKSRNCCGYREGVKNGLIPVEEQPAVAEAGPSSSTMQPSSSNKRQALGLSQQRASKHGFRVLSRVAAKLLCMHHTACACERNWSAWGQMYTKLRFKMAVERARKLIYVHGNGKESGKEDMDLCLNLPKEEA